jgi:hypothetical protein
MTKEMVQEEVEILLSATFDKIMELPQSVATREALPFVQMAMAKFSTEKAMAMRGRIAGGASLGGPIVKTGDDARRGRFNTTPPVETFADPNQPAAMNPVQLAGQSDEQDEEEDDITDGPGLKAVLTPDNPNDPPLETDLENIEQGESEVQEIEVAPQEIEDIYNRIAASTKEQVVTQYGESSIENMIMTLGGNVAKGKTALQKASFLISMTKQRMSATPK